MKGDFKLNSVEGLSEVNKMRGAIENTSEHAVKKRRKIAETSRESFRELLEDGTFKNQNEIMIKCLSEHQPLTRRQAAKVSGIELNSAGRCFCDLEKLGLIKVAFTAKSPDTKKRVGFYALVDWEQKANEYGGASNVN